MRGQAAWIVHHSPKELQPWVPVSDDCIQMIKLVCLEEHPAFCHWYTLLSTTLMLKNHNLKTPKLHPPNLIMKLEIVGQACNISVCETEEEESCKLKVHMMYIKTSRKWTDN